MSKLYVVTFTNTVEAESEDEAIQLADHKGGGHWEARELRGRD